MFSGSFASIFWLKKRGVMPGLTFSNELISRDEGCVEFATQSLWPRIRHKPTEQEVLEVVTSCVDLEIAFVCEALDVSLLGMNKVLMADYIRFVADRLLVSLGFEKHYGVAQPFEWVETVNSLQGKTSFFERRVSEYQVGAMAAAQGRDFSMDAEF